MKRLAKKAPKTKSTTLVEVQKALVRLHDDVGMLMREREEERAAELRRDEALEEVIKQGTKATATIEGAKAAKVRR
jgi:hypothetical protein